MQVFTPNHRVLAMESTGELLTWKCPTRFPGPQIPTQVYDEIFAWLQPKHDPDADLESQQETLARLAPVCRYFTHYAARESWRRIDFDGGVEDSLPQTQTWQWVNCNIQRFQLAETQRIGVKECIIQYWHHVDDRSAELVQMVRGFLLRFPRLFSTLDNLGVLTLSKTPISYSLLQTVGRLPRLEQLVISWCSVGDGGDDDPDGPIFGIHETPFPALSQLTIEDSEFPKMDAVFEDAFCALVGASSLRSLAISCCYWMYLFFPNISRHLVSLSGNFTNIRFDSFLQLIKELPSLQDLTICSDVWAWFLDHKERKLLPIYPSTLGADDLPNLRSFSGPFSLAPKFIRDRSVTRLALGCHLPPQDSDIPLTSLHGLTVFPHTHSALYTWEDLYVNNHYVWDDLEDIGGRIQDLFIRFDLTGEPPSLITSCFPNLVHLQVEPWTWSTYDFNNRGVILPDYLLGFGDALKDLKSLKILTLSDTDIYDRYRYRSLWLSPGDQHNFVHRLFHKICPTLTMVVFSPWMVWHSRRPTLGNGECHCELELLSARNIREELRRLAEYDDPLRVPVRDWNGKLAGSFGGEPFGLHEGAQEVLKAMLVDTAFCS